MAFIKTAFSIALFVIGAYMFIWSIVSLFTENYSFFGYIYEERAAFRYIFISFILSISMMLYSLSPSYDNKKTVEKNQQKQVNLESQNSYPQQENFTKIKKEPESLTLNYIFVVILGVFSFLILYREIGLFLYILSEGSIENITYTNGKHGITFYGKEALVQHFLLITIAVIMLLYMAKPLRFIINNLRNKK